MQEGTEAAYDEKSDIWALGLVLYFMFNYQRNLPTLNERLRASLPWEGNTHSAIYKNIMSKPLTFKNPDIPPEIM